MGGSISFSLSLAKAWRKVLVIPGTSATVAGVMAKAVDILARGISARVLFWYYVCRKTRGQPWA